MRILEAIIWYEKKIMAMRKFSYQTKFAFVDAKLALKVKQITPNRLVREV